MNYRSGGVSESESETTNIEGAFDIQRSVAPTLARVV